METTDYVSYPIALALKKAGFDWPCDKWIASKSFSYYDEDECCDHNAVIEKGWLISQKQKEKYDQEALPYLTLWQAQKWLREVKRIEVNASWDSNERHWFYYSGSMDSPAFAYDSISDAIYSTYEQALSAGIEAAIKLIEKKD